MSGLFNLVYINSTAICISCLVCLLLSIAILPSGDETNSLVLPCVAHFLDLCWIGGCMRVFLPCLTCLVPILPIDFNVFIQYKFFFPCCWYLIVIPQYSRTFLRLVISGLSLPNLFFNYVLSTFFLCVTSLDHWCAM